jgi:recombination protein RecA
MAGSNELDKVTSEVNKRFGEDSIIKLSNVDPAKYERLSSGIFSLDMDLGGGWPVGKIVELFGFEQTGKSFIGYHTAASFQRQGKRVLWIDLENSLDPEWASTIGVDVDELLVGQPGNLEEACDIVETYAKTGVVDLIVYDSVAAGIPRAELEGEMGDQQVGLQPRLMGKICRKLTAAHSEGSRCLVLFINQVRQGGFGSQYPVFVTPGGNALKFFADIRIEVKRPKDGLRLDDEKNIIGQTAHYVILKNKTFPMMRRGRFYFEKETAQIDNMSSVVAFGVRTGLIQRAGAWYEYDGQKFQGEKKLAEHIQSLPPKEADALRQAIEKAWLKR